MSSAGPSTVARVPSIATRSSPPGIAIRTGLSHQPRATAAAATATADEPDAAVSPRSPLPDEDRDDVTRLGPGQLDVRPVRESRMRLDRRTDAQQVVTRQHITEHDRMRVPEPDGNDGQSLSGDVEHLVAGDDHLVEPLPYEPTAAHGGTDGATRRRDLDLARARLP